MAIYLLNPFTLMACIAGTTTTLENLFVLAGVCGACLGSVTLTGAALAVATYLGVQPVLLLVRI